MFTGLIEEKGKILKVLKSDNGVTLHISAQKVLDGMIIGDSVAANGVCLTVKNMGATCYGVDLLNETINVTNFKNVQEGDVVNLERAMKMGDRLNGHIVSGHVDTTVPIIAITSEGSDKVIEFEMKPEFKKYISLKGSVTLNGVSLTVARMSETSFTVSLIPLTQEKTSFGTAKVGDLVNIEFDQIIKYLEQLQKGAK
jgi:riboflavin synthase